MTARVGIRARLLPVLAVGLTMVFGVASCSSEAASVAEPPSATAQQPLPPDVSFDNATAPPVSPTECNTSGLRPTEQPEPRKMPDDSTMARIFERGRLIVGTDLGSNPLSFRDPISGDVKGFDIDVAHWIAGAIFGDENLIEYRMLANEDRIKALQDGSVDIVVKSMSITCDRLGRSPSPCPTTPPHSRSSPSGTPASPSRPTSRARTSARPAPPRRSLAQRSVPSAKYVTTGSWADCLVMMQQGQVDAITSDDTILAGIASQDPWVHVVGDSLGTENYGVGIPQGQDDFVRFVNGVLAQRKTDGSWQRSYNRWLSLLGPGSPPPTTYRD